jgi:hypothetical protein
MLALLMMTMLPLAAPLRTGLKTDNQRRKRADYQDSVEEGSMDELPVAFSNYHRNHSPLNDLKYRLEEAPVTYQSQPKGHNIKNVLSLYLSDDRLVATDPWFRR